MPSVIIPAKSDGISVDIHFNNTRIFITKAECSASGKCICTPPCSYNNKSIDYVDIKAVHVKNAETYLLKIRLANSALILDFQSVNIRDLVKSLILCNIMPDDKMQELILQRNSEARVLNSNIKAMRATSGKPETTNNITNNTTNIFNNISPKLYLQKKPCDIYSKDFLNSLTQPLIDIFISMNYSINQFYNLVTTSYFYDIKNQKNTIDRILSEKIRNFNTEIDFASRINTYSHMLMDGKNGISDDGRIKKHKSVEFEPIRFLYDNCKYGSNTNTLINNSNTVINNSNTVINNLNTNFILDKNNFFFDADIKYEKTSLNFDPKDFELARDLCKIVYLNNPELIGEALEFSKGFKEMVQGKYGNEGLKYFDRLIPSYYYQSKK